MLPPFEIHRPATAAEAAALRARLGEAAAIYAGGSELLLAMKEGLAGFAHLIDVKGIPDLKRLDTGADGTLVIGAAVTHRELETSDLARRLAPLLTETERQVANPRVRAVGTLGGNLCFGEPHSDPATTLLVHQTRVALQGPRAPRWLPLADFMTGSYETALAPDEILTRVEVAPLSPGARTAYLKFGMHERPTVGVAVCLVPDPAGRTVLEARVAVGCVGPVATRLPALEQRLVGVELGTLARGFADAEGAGAGLDAVSDLHGSAEYKRHLAGVFVKRALAGAAQVASPAPVGRARRRSAAADGGAPPMPGAGPAHRGAGVRPPGPPPGATRASDGAGAGELDVDTTLNGARVTLRVRPEDLLLDVLRDQCRLTGSKRSCDVQVCGACTVLLDGAPVSACSVLALEARGRQVLTIEGLADGERLHPVQQAFLAESAFQCGYCTPGMIMAVKTLLDDVPDATPDETRDYLRGNICRCTGYVTILAAVAAAQRGLSNTAGS